MTLHLHWRCLRWLSFLFLIALGGLCPLFMVEQTTAQSGVCQSSNASTYSVTVCITDPAIGAIISGLQPVTATVDVTGTNPGVNELRFYLSSSTQINDGFSPYTFVLPSHYFIDGSRSLAVEAKMADGFVSSRASVTVNFQNGVTTTPVNPNTFAPSVGSGAVMFAAVGDGAGYYPENPLVADLIASKQPDFFLYLGDVYNKGSHSEFYNWYGPRGEWGYGLFADITNPIVGNHEYGSTGAAPYFFYWNNVPHYYSYNSGGWHFVALDSNTSFSQLTPGTAQYDWLVQDLNTNTLPCVLVYAHHPRYSVGPGKDNPSMDPIWKLLAQEGVDVLMTGHDHSYQRWRPLDGDGNPDPQGMTQFIVGTGGNDNQSLARSDARVEYRSSSYYGALFMNLAPTYMDYNFINLADQVRDAGRVNCSGTIPPPTQVITFTPVADAYVRSNTPTTSYGTLVNLQVDALPETYSYLRFDVQELAGPVVDAKLYLHTTNKSTPGYEVFSVSDTVWEESSVGAITWNNKPTLGSYSGSSGSISSNTWTTATVTSLVAGNGLFSLALTGSSTSEVNFSSREGANPPVLEVTVNLPDVDTDGDRLPDQWEVEHGLDPNSTTDANGAQGDPDGDGISNLDEYIQNTDPQVPNGPPPVIDSDSDGLTDTEEVTLGTNPQLYDSDGDGLGDGEEVALGTKPDLADTDADGLPDGWEVVHALDPKSGTGANGAQGNPDGDGFSNLDEYNQNTDPNTPNGPGPGVDSDDDGLTNEEEVTYGTNPNLFDSDGDGLSDGEEVALGTNPNSVDTDTDGLPDGWEVGHDLDPKSSIGADGAQGDPDADGLSNLNEYNQNTDPNTPNGPGPGVDSDGDGLTNGEEAALGTNPNSADTDGDGLPDGWEVGYDLDPKSGVGADGAQGDPDGDGISNLVEYSQQTDPQVPNGPPPVLDSDGDSLTDAEEATLGTNPNSPDTDGDGLPDGWEVEHELDAKSGEGVNGAQGDPDGDSISNLDEYNQQTDPRAPNDVPNEKTEPLFLPFISGQ